MRAFGTFPSSSFLNTAGGVSPGLGSYPGALSSACACVFLEYKLEELLGV